MKPLTKAQRLALYKVYIRHFVQADTTEVPSYWEFRRTVERAFYDDCIMVPIPAANLWVGIETDGYTHS